MIQINKASVVILLVIFIVTYWNTSYFIMDKELGHNMMESLLVGSAPLHNLGVPYKDYWGIYPPGIYIFMGLFDILFQGNVLVFKILHFTILFGTLLIFWRLLLRLFKEESFLYINLLVIIASFYYASIAFNNVLFSSVLISNFFSLVGLWLLLFSRNQVIKYVLSAAIFAWVALLKDPYELLIFLPFFAIIMEVIMRNANLKLLFSKELLIKFLFSVIGISVVFIIHMIYVFSLGILKSYGDIISFKRESFLNFPAYPNNFEGSVYFFQLFLNNIFSLSEILIPLVVSLLFILVYVHKKHAKSELRINYLVIISFCLLNFMTFKLQNRVGATYSLQVILPLFLLIALLTTASLKLIRKVPSFFICLFLITVLLPKSINWRPYSLSRPLGPRVFIQNLFNPGKYDETLLTDSRVVNLLKKDNRVLDLYGWGTPNFYYRYKVKPFNRFFIVHPNLMGEKQNKEWVLSFESELPKIVKYGGNGSGADMNVDKFESSTINIQKLLRDCYSKISDEIYILPSGKCDSFYKDANLYVNNDFVAFFKK